MSKIVGYARVSTKEQNLERQIKALSEYVDEGMIVTDKASGKDLNRPGYQSLKYGIGKLTEGDTLYIKSIDRLSRNKEQAKEELRYYQRIGVRVKILDIPTTMADIHPGQEWIIDMINNIIIEVLSSVAENERQTIRQRQREGYDAMKTTADGKRISSKTGNVVGRPKAVFPSNWNDVYFQWKNSKITAKTAMEMLNLKRNTFYKLVKEYAKDNP